MNNMCDLDLNKYRTNVEVSFDKINNEFIYYRNR